MGSVRFLDLFGFVCSGLGNTGLEKCVVICERQCSGCTVDFVEKMWENLWGSRWENCGRRCGKGQIVMFLHSLCEKNKKIRSRSGKFCGWICTWFYLCEGGGFAQFPHSLLLQLLNI